MIEPSEPDPAPVSLSRMNKSELLDYAEELGIEGLDGLTKAQIIELIKEAQ